jgi:putative transposase
MDNFDRWADNIYIERFWRTIKQEKIYINPGGNLTDLNNQITKFIEFYNYQRPHQSLLKKFLHKNSPRKGLRIEL